MGGPLARLGAVIVRFRVAVIVLWVLAAVIGAIVGGGVFDRTADLPDSPEGSASALADQRLDELDHLRDVPSGARLVRGRQDAQGPVRVGEDELVVIGVRPPLAALLDGLREDLVVDVRRVADEGDLQTPVEEPAAQLVVDDAGAHVAHVRGALHGGTADVHPHVSVAHGREGDEGAGIGAVQSYHAGQSTERTRTRPRRRTVTGSDSPRIGAPWPQTTKEYYHCRDACHICKDFPREYPVLT